MAGTTRTIGTTTVDALLDGVGEFFEPARTAFPEAPDAAWEAARRLDPDAFAGDQWRLRYRCFLLRPADRTTVLFDAGIGPVGAPAGSWAPVPGRLPEALAAAGVTPADIDIVVISHLHADHIGWTVDHETRKPYFPNARYILQQAEYDALGAARERHGQILDPLSGAGQLQLIEGELALTPDIRLMHTPGHTPGHQVALVRSGEETLLVAGDLLVHALQLVDPTVRYRLETDPDAARASRRRYLATATTIATAHLTDPFHSLPTAGRPNNGDEKAASS